MKLKKDPLKVNFSKQNLSLSVLKYQKKFQMDWTGITRKLTPLPPPLKKKKKRKEKRKRNVRYWQNSVSVT